MIKHFSILLLSLILLSLSACKEREILAEADAYAITSAADQEAADREQARAQDQDLHDHQMGIRQSATVIAKVMIQAVVIALGLSLSAMLLTTGVAYHKASQGISRALVMAAELRANLIPLDVRTRQYPLLRHVQGNRWALANPNDGSVRMLDSAQEADRKLIAAMCAVQYGGLLAYEAGRAGAGEVIPNIPLLLLEDPTELRAAIDYETQRLENTK